MSYNPTTGEWIEDGVGVAPSTTSDNEPTVGVDVNLPTIDPTATTETTTAAYQNVGTNILGLQEAEGTKGVGYVPPDTTGYGVKPGEGYLTPESTVAGQLDRLLAKDSPYIKRARAGAAEVAQSRGVLSSTMAAAAGEGAAIERALPIASQDAKTVATLQAAQQMGEINQTQAQIEGFVSGALQNQKYGLINQTQALEKSFNALISGADAEAGVALQELKSKWDFALADSVKRLEFSLQEDLNSQQFSQQTAENVRAQSIDLIKNNQIAIENLLKDPDMLALGTESMNNMINNMINMTTTSIQFAYSAASLDVDQYVLDALDIYEESTVFG